MHSIGLSAKVAMASWYRAWKCGRWWGAPSSGNIRTTIPKKRDNSGTAVLYIVSPDFVGPPATPHQRRFTMRERRLVHAVLAGPYRSYLKRDFAIIAWTPFV